MEFPLSQLASILPTELDLLSVLKFILVFAATALILSLFGRVILGKRSALNRAVSSAMGILFVYVATIVIHTFNPAGLSRFLTPLPYVEFSEEYLYILSFRSAGFPAICENILSMLILAFLVNVLDGWIPRGKSVAGWFLLRILCVLLAMGLHFLVDLLSRTFLPGVLVTYAPIILLGILIVMFVLGVLSVLLGLVLTMVHPILGGIYAFFFSNALGKQLSKAILTTTLITALICALDHFGYSIICITSSALIAYLPLLLALLLLWYLVGRLL